MAYSLPTRERNALRGLFDKPEFSVDEVLAVDYRVIRRLPGVGPKGIEHIRQWIESHGRRPVHWPQNKTAHGLPAATLQRLESAARLLRRHGYEVIPPCPTE
jgi:hypothetical protein